jgi:hypothetical protein
VTKKPYRPKKQGSVEQQIEAAQKWGDVVSDRIAQEIYKMMPPGPDRVGQWDDTFAFVKEPDRLLSRAIEDYVSEGTEEAQQKVLQAAGVLLDAWKRALEAFSTRDSTTPTTPLDPKAETQPVVEPEPAPNALPELPPGLEIGDATEEEVFNDPDQTNLL